MTMVQSLAHSRDMNELCRLERFAFAAKIRLARAVIGWSQSELGIRAGLTQRTIHRLEQGDTEPRRTTMRALQAIWREQGLEFDDLPDGGFRVSIGRAVLDKAPSVQSYERPAATLHLNTASIARRFSTFRTQAPSLSPKTDDAPSE